MNNEIDLLDSFRKYFNKAKMDSLFDNHIELQVVGIYEGEQVSDYSSETTTFMHSHSEADVEKYRLAINDGIDPVIYLEDYYINTMVVLPYLIKQAYKTMSRNETLDFKVAKLYLDLEDNRIKLMVYWKFLPVVEKKRKV